MRIPPVVSAKEENTSFLLMYVVRMNTPSHFDITRLCSWINVGHGKDGFLPPLFLSPAGRAFLDALRCGIGIAFGSMMS